MHQSGGDGPPSGRSRGRPPATSAAEIAAAALRLFHERGYEDTTMDDVARAVGVARRTVFSYYPSKGAIVWAGEREAADALVDALTRVPADVAWRSALVEVLPEALRYPGDDTGLLRSRLVLIGRTPELRAHLALQQESATEAVAAFIAGRSPDGDDGLVPHVAARAVLASLSAALTWWATSEQPDLRAVLRRALAALLTPAAGRAAG